RTKNLMRSVKHFNCELVLKHKENKTKKIFSKPLDTGKKEIIIKASFGNGRQTRPAKRFNVRPYMTGSVTSGARLMIGGLHDEHLSSYRFR
ncbi:MAG: hypothetical protein ACLS6G_14965, partial [Christensenellales bacterium]